MSTIIETYPLPTGQSIEIAQGDLTKEHVDAIVNAANSVLAHGGGVAGAIVRAGGASIQQESESWVHKYGPVTHAEPAYTGAGKLPCRYVIHAVGPIWGEGEEDRKLEEAIRGCLQRAEMLNIQSIAIPAISTGIFGYPRDRAARIMIEALYEFFHENPTTQVELVRLVLLDEETVEIFSEEARRQLGKFLTK